MTVSLKGFFLAGGLALALVGCTLEPGTPQVQVRVVAPPGLRTARDLQVADVDCFALVVNGLPGPVTSTEVGNRVPTCLGLNGKFQGAFTYAELSGAGTKVTLSPGRYTLSLVGMENVSGCSGLKLGYFYPNSDTGVAQTYAIGTTGEIEITPSTSRVTISATQFSPTAPVNLTSGCPRQGGECTGADVCDTFSENGVNILAHTMETGGQWSVTDARDPEISAGWLNMSANPGFESRFITSGPSRDEEISASVKIQSAGLGTVTHRLIGRWSDAQNFEMAELTVAPSGCSLAIYEYIGNTPSLKASLANLICAYDEVGSFSFRMNSVELSAIFNGQSASAANASPVLTGTSIGFGSGQSGAFISPQEIDFIKASPPIQRRAWRGNAFAPGEFIWR